MPLNANSAPQFSPETLQAQRKLRLNPEFNKGGTTLIREIEDKATAIEQSDNISVLKFHIGNPGTPQHPVVTEAMKNSIKARKSVGYEPTSVGAPEIRSGIANYFNKNEGLAPDHFKPEDVVVMPSATIITDMLISVLTDEPKKDIGILTPLPGFNVYKQQASGNFATPIEYPLDDRNLPRVSDIITSIDAFQEKNQSAEAKLLIISYPHNPTGKALNAEEAKEVGGMINELTKRYPQLVFYNDSIYSSTAKEYHSFYPHLSDNAKRRTITGLSGSKALAMPAERIAAVAGINSDLISALKSMVTVKTAGSNVHAQAGLVAGLNAGQDISLEISKFYSERRKKCEDMLKTVNESLGEKVIEGEDQGGSMFFYAKFDALKDTKIPKALQEAAKSDVLRTSKQLTDMLLNAHKINLTPVALVPATAFGVVQDKIHARIACVNPDLRDFDMLGNTLQGVAKRLLGKKIEAAQGTPKEATPSLAATTLAAESSAPSQNVWQDRLNNQPSQGRARGGATRRAA